MHTLTVRSHIFFHNSEVTCASLRLKSLATRLFVWHFVNANGQVNIKAPYYCFCGWRVNSVESRQRCHIMTSSRTRFVFRLVKQSIKYIPFILIASKSKYDWVIICRQNLQPTVTKNRDNLHRINILRPEQNGSHFAYDILHMTLLSNGNLRILIQISQKLVSRSLLTTWVDAV